MFGLHLPGLPEVYTTHQIQCVACQELFAVAEGKIVYETRAAKGSRRETRPLWRVPPDRISNIRLRYENNRSRQAVRSPSRANPNIRLEPHQVGSKDTYINCPRCGADNRNWLQIIAPRIILPSGALDMILPNSLRLWRQRFPLAFFSVVFATVLGFVVFLISLIEAISIPQALLIGAMAILAAFLTSTDLIHQWPQIRMQRHIRLVLPPKRGSRNSLILRGFILTLLFALVFPLLFFRAMPRAMQLGSRFIKQGESNTAVTTDKKTPVELFDTFNPKAHKEFKALIREVDRMNLGDSEDLQAIFSTLAETNREIKKARDDYQKGLNTFFNSIPKTAKQAQDQAESQQIEGITGNLLFLILWTTVIGLSTMCATFLANSAVRKYVTFVDSQLPPPIFHSIADMTRVVIWEAKRALDIAGDMGHIQWMKAYRNPYGGIDLTGLHREVPDVDQANNNISSMVQAQEYTIYSDMWGRIQSTRIVDKRAPQAAGAHGFSLNTTAAPHRRPLPPDDPYAELFNPGRSPQEPAWVSVEPTRKEPDKKEDTTQSANRPRTAASPQRAQPSSRSIHEPNFATQLSRGKLTQLHHELADKMGYFLSLAQIEEISESFNVHFPHLVNPELRDRCYALIQRVQQQNQVRQLMQRCLDANEEAFWGDTLLLLDAAD